MSRAARSAGAGPARLLRSVDPCDGRLIASHSTLDGPAVERRLARAVGAVGPWAERTPDERAALLGALADGLEERRDKLALLVTSEMGKRLGEARAEVDKCAWACRYYAEHASAWLADEPVETAATASWVSYRPLGVLLAVMPWNFPLWQVFRCVAPALAAGNAIVLKHASNVSLCALAIDSLCRDSGLPPGVVQTLLIDSTRVEALVTDPRIAAVSVTGSEAAGRAVAASAGRALKKCVLELGGSDPFVVLDDADLDSAVTTAVAARFDNAGQSCIAAKRFIVVDQVADAFVERFADAARDLHTGDPRDPATALAPLARTDLRDDLHTQVVDSVSAGARIVSGAQPLAGPGAYYPATVLDEVRTGMPVAEDEVFGPVAAVMRVSDERAALATANATRFGLGASVWTRDAARGRAFAAALDCGAAFVNARVRSDPRLPFGGIKASGYGRELARHGLREFTNAKTLWLD